jgi:hypothetical protein
MNNIQTFILIQNKGDNTMKNTDEEIYKNTNSGRDQK